MSKTELLPVGSIAWIMKQVMEQYNESNIEGLVIGMKLKDGSFICAHSTGDDFSYLEKLGLISQIEEDVKSGVR